MSCCLFLPKDYDTNSRRYPVIYVNGDVQVQEMIDETGKAGLENDFILLSIQPESWNDDFTPWSAPAFRKGEEAPAGKADDYLACLVRQIKPYIDSHYRTQPEPEHTVLLGYSLGGLTAVYAIYKTDRFGIVGSLSGSLWYDGFCEFIEDNRPLRRDAKVYLSLGKKESQSRNPRMRKVAECTQRAEHILKRHFSAQDKQADLQSVQTDIENACANRHVYFEWNEGGHFSDIPKRFAKAIIWLLSYGMK